MFSADRDDLPRFTELESEYEFVGELGRGGTAVVYLARERELDRKVAIKVIRATYVEDEEAAARLTREALTVAGMQHPNIVMLYGTRRLRDSSLALLMQYVEGRTLKAEVEETGALSFERTEQILRDIGSALAYAHRHRIVHRDIKPENIYIDAETGMARLSDFGIARPWDADSGLTLPGSAIGTPAYMSPEQIDGGVLDGRSDIYSLGLVGYEMLSGARPWAGETLFSIVVKQKHEELPALAEVRPGIPRNLREAIERAVRKDADQRWQNADAFLRVLSGRTAPQSQHERVGEAGAEARSQAPVSGGKSGRRARKAARSGSPVTSGRARGAKGRGVRERKVARLERPVAGGHTIRFERHVENAPAGPARQYERRNPIPETRGGPPAERTPGHARMQKPATALAAALRQLRRWPLAAAVVAGVIVVGTGVTLAFSDQAGDPRAGAGVAGAAAAPAEAVNAADSDDSNGAAAGPAARAFPLYGDQQAGIAGDTLPVPLVIQVEDAAGRAIAGASVSFAVATGAGTVHPVTALTDEAGTATARWLPRTPGVSTAEAQVEGLHDAVPFRATVLPRPPARLSSASPTELRGTAGTPSTLAVKVEDDRGNAVAGVEIRFAVRGGEGRITPAAPVTGGDGIARADWVLGSAASQEAVATLPAAAGADVVFRATAAPAPLPVQRTVALGGTHTCVLAGDGTATCWGGNDSGQLGDATASRRATPVRVAAPEPLATIAAGVGHSCAVGVSGSVFCWGANTAGQLGDGSRTSRAQPARVSSEERLTNVAVGMSHSCALDAAGRLFCWGQNTSGQLGDGTQTSRTTPVRAGGTRTFRSFALGWAHTCALTADGAAYCWGRNDSGALGDGGSTDRAEPERVSGGYRFTAIVAGSGHTCGLVADGAIVCWGLNANGQLGNGATGSSSLPVAVIGATPFATLAAGGVHTCALTRDGAAHCWGRNTYGQLGDGTVEDRALAAPVASGLRFSSIFASGAHTCATAVGGALHCWGFNLEGQIGDGTRSNQLRPVPAGRQE